jgi:hypothetical protein
MNKQEILDSWVGKMVAVHHYPFYVGGILQRRDEKDGKPSYRVETGGDGFKPGYAFVNFGLNVAFDEKPDILNIFY